MASTTTKSIDSGAILQLKPAREPFGVNRRTGSQTFFLHPGYPDNHNILLSLPALDSAGIHHETARIACAILANSRWDGFLSLTRDGPALTAAPDAIIPCRRYYFRITDDDMYPIVPSFDHFTYPSDLPDQWSDDTHAPIDPSIVDDVGKRDLTCRVTGSLMPNETTHVIPQAQSEWWQRNSMFTYTANPDQSLDSKCADNTILLRRDVHKMWDDHRFAVVPKCGKWVLHVLWNSPTVELEEEYHNLPLQPLCGVSRYFFFCRFALAVLCKSTFLSQGVPRKLVTLVRSGSPRVRSMSADEYRGFFNTTGRAQSRSQSPKKRQRSAQDSLDGMQSGSESEVDGLVEAPSRGRTLKRKHGPVVEDEDLEDTSRCRKQPRPSWANRTTLMSPSPTWEGGGAAEAEAEARDPQGP